MGKLEGKEMTVTDRRRVAQVRSKRAQTMGTFLTRLMNTASYAASSDDLLDVEQSEDLAKRIVVGREEARQSGSHRRSPPLSRDGVQSLGLALRTQVPNLPLRIYFENHIHMGALSLELHTLLGNAPAFADVGMLAFGPTNDAASGIAIDFLPPGDWEAKHPEGSYELSVWGPVFATVRGEWLA